LVLGAAEQLERQTRARVIGILNVDFFRGLILSSMSLPRCGGFSSTSASPPSRHASARPAPALGNPAPLGYRPALSLARAFAAQSQLALLRLGTSPTHPWFGCSLLSRSSPTRLGRPTGRSRTALGGLGATLTRVRHQSGSAVVASFRRRHPPATFTSLHPGPGKPPLTTLGPLREGHLAPVPRRRLPQWACHAPPGDATVTLFWAARAVELPIPYPFPPRYPL